MSIDARVSRYGKLFNNWTLGKEIGTGSMGKTAVFHLCRKNKTYTEEALLSTDYQFNTYDINE